MRVVRRIIGHHRKVGGFGREVPHELGYALPASELAVVDRDALAVTLAYVRNDAMVLLLAEGPALERRRLALGLYAAWEAPQPQGVLSPLAVRERIAEVGATEWDEVRGLLRARRRLLPPRPGAAADGVTWSLFAAYWAELRVFEPNHLAYDFPSLVARRDAIDQLLAADVPWPIPSDPLPIADPRGQPDPRPEDHALGARLEARFGEAALGVSGPWAVALAPLQGRSDRRLRLDLEKACFDAERTFERTDLLAWILSLGRHPLRRPLPTLTPVRTVRHLARARHRIATAGLSPAEAERLDALVARALEAAETRLRDELRPAIHAATLPAVGHATVVESVAHAKLVDELLDRVVARGRLDFPTLRDAVARNQAKLADLDVHAFRSRRAQSACPRRFLRDPLLVSDRSLSLSLAGVHRRGEAYRRGLHRLSALVFGTPLGRLMTRFVLVPALGAYALLELLQHTVLFLVEAAAKIELPIVTPLSFALTAVVLFGLVNVPPFRRAAQAGLAAVGRALRAVFVTLPRWIAARPWVHAWFASPAWRLIVRWLLVPAALAAPLAIPIALGLFDLPPPARLAALIGLVPAAAALANSLLGQRLADLATLALVATRRAITQHFLPAFLGWIISVFRALLDGLERILYAVDEHLRTRVGDRRRRAIALAILALPWRLLAYVLRLYVNVSLEPKVNPVKHFPAVTIGHKIVLPLSFSLDAALAAPLGPSTAHIVAAAMLFIVPGLFGFLAWELKENWRLYAANRPRLLRPTVIGSHGETMARLLCRGFHSGTLPKLYAKLRRIARRPASRLRTRRLHVLAERRAHLVHDLAHFAERELLALLAPAGMPLVVVRVEVASNRIRIHLGRPNATAASHVAPRAASAWAPAAGWILTFAAHADGLVATVAPLPDEARDGPAFVLAVRGASSLAGAAPAPPAAPLTWEVWSAAWESTFARL